MVTLGTRGGLGVGLVLPIPQRPMVSGALWFALALVNGAVAP